MDLKAINFDEKFKKFTEHWSPKIIAQMNDYHFKLVKIQGEFVWHKHEETDEVFIVLDGEMSIAFRDNKVKVKKGEMIVVPKGIEHKPIADGECKLIVIEPAGTVNTGDAGGNMTVDEICQYIGADSLKYLTIEDLRQCVKAPEGFCYACFDGNYPIPKENRGTLT